jgi:hypothetical protein
MPRYKTPFYFCLTKKSFFSHYNIQELNTVGFSARKKSQEKVSLYNDCKLYFETEFGLRNRFYNNTSKSNFRGNILV